MLIELRDVLPADEVRRCRAALLGAGWVDGRATAGHLAIHAKRNRQLPVTDPVAREVGDRILDALGGNPAFIAATLPLKVMPPTFNRYAGGETYGEHVDNAIRNMPGSAHRVRTDISCTLFLTDPDSYDGGELQIEDTFGLRSVKLGAGSLVVYPGTSLHRVAPVTRGERISAFFWVQSLVRDDTRRALLLELDRSIQELTQQLPQAPALTRLTGIYHNLLRQWADT